MPDLAPPTPDVLDAWKRELRKNQDDLNVIEQRVQALKEDTEASESRGFWKDILSDADGVGLHRFQMVTWTLVLGIVFLSAVVYSLKMPDFSTTLLALLGISNATYIGFKFPDPGKP